MMTRLELMTQNKIHYEEVSNELIGMQDGLEKAVKKELILRWIKGTGWIGGLGTPQERAGFDKLHKIGYVDDDVICREFDEQVEMYSEMWGM